MEWKVSKEVIEIFPHERADSLEIAKVGDYQLVVRKGTYKTGDVVIFIPEKSLIYNEELRKEFEDYLSGGEKRKVKSITLRGELSQGVTIPEYLGINYVSNQALNFTHEESFQRSLDFLHAEIGQDISELLNIKKWEPTIPAQLRGMIAGIKFSGAKGEINVDVQRSDCYPFGAFSNQLDPEERVVVTEKLHGSQINYVVHFEPEEAAYDDYMLSDGTIETYRLENTREYSEVVSSKGLLGKGLAILESEENTYWQAVRNSGLLHYARMLLIASPDEEAVDIQIIGEVIPVQKGFDYGETKPVVKVFDVFINGKAIAYDTVVVDTSDVYTLSQVLNWVPVLYDGPLNDLDPYKLAKGKSHLDNKTILEGCVVRPYDTSHKMKSGQQLHLKIISESYMKGGFEEDAFN